MTTIAFWNVCKNGNINETIINLIVYYNIDILCLCEYNDNQHFLLMHPKVTGRGLKSVNFIASSDDMCIFYNSNKISNTGLITDQSRYSINEFEIGGRILDITLLHLPSKLYHENEHECAIIAKEIIYDIQKYEEIKGHRLSAIIGDFNMDPYETSMLWCDSFHAYPDLRETNKARAFQGKQYSSFYNPMWGMFGDRILPPGTYYYSKSGEAPNWHIFDQVLLRYQLAEMMDKESLQIIKSIGNDSILDSKGRPNKELFSDHLPIIFTLRGGF